MLTRTAAIAAVALAISCAAPASARANSQICAEPTTKYGFTSVAISTRPTNVKSAYITGPGTLIYGKTISASVGMSATNSVTVEAGVVVAKASSQLGVSLAASLSWRDQAGTPISVQLRDRICQSGGECATHRPGR